MGRLLIRHSPLIFMQDRECNAGVENTSAATDFSVPVVKWSHSTTAII